MALPESGHLSNDSRTTAEVKADLESIRDSCAASESSIASLSTTVDDLSTAVGTLGGLTSVDVTGPTATAEIRTRQYIDSFSNAITLTIDTAVGNRGEEIDLIFVRIVNPVTLNTTSGQKIGTRASGELVFNSDAQGLRLSLISNGSDWCGNVPFI